MTGRPRSFVGSILAGAARWSARIAVLVVALLGSYALAVVAGAGITGAAETAGGGRPVTIYVATNGFHSDLILPARNGERDWSELLARSPITRERIAGTGWIAFGWGSRTAYTRLGEITDLTPEIAVRALAFDVSVMHVVPLASVDEGAGVHEVTLTGDGYRRLVRFVERSFAGAGGPEPLPGVTHGYGDAFFRGRGRFSFLRGCNVWAGEGLRIAGHRTGIWTPFAQSLMWSAGF